MSRTAAEPESRHEQDGAPDRPAVVETVAFQVGAADDQYEQAADRTADQVLRRLADQGALGGEDPGSGGGRAAGAIGAEGGAVDTDTASRIRGSSGSPLPAEVRRSMEGAFGTDLGSVRLHTGPAAAALSSRLGARAFTVGQDVFLGQGTPSLASRQGQHLLAHELAHTQQQGGGAHRTVRRDTGVQTRPRASGGTPPALAQQTRPRSSGQAPAPALAPGQFSGLSGLDPATQAPAPEEVGGGALNTASESMTMSTAIDQVSGGNSYYATMNEVDGGERGTLGAATSQDNLGYASGAVAGVGLVLASIKTFRSGYSTPQEAWEAVLGMSGGVTGTANALGSVAKTAEGGDGEKVVKDGKTEVVGAASGTTKEAASVLSEIAGIVGSIQAAYEAVKAIVAAVDHPGLESGVPSPASVKAVQAAVTTGRAALETVNTFLSHLGGITAPMVTAVPALGIVVGALDILANGIALGIAYSSWSEMRRDKRAAKAIIFQAKTVERTTTYLGLGNRSAVAEAQAILADMNASPALKDAARDYTISRELQVITGKRIKRNVLNIATTLPGIAGDIAILSGAGAGVGVGLKVASSGAKGLSALFRVGKQYYHDKTGHATKSTEAKRAAYDKIITGIVDDMVASESIADPAQKGKRQQTLTARMEASGMSLRALKALQATTPPADLGKNLWKAWLAALKNRDGA